MSQHQAASDQFDRHVNPADGVGSLTHGPRTHPAHAEGRLMYNGADRDGQNGNSGLGIHRVDFVKLDVDGHEADVLEGARQTFTRHHPQIVMELAPFVYRDEMRKFAFMLEFFWTLGYQLTDLSSGTVLPRDTRKVVQMIPDKGGINVLGRRS